MPMIYFIQVRSKGPIKIGITQHAVEQRLATLQSGCPWKLNLLTYREGTFIDERATHFKFRHLRLSGEWFLPDDELLRFIDGVKQLDFSWPISPPVRAPSGKRPLKPPLVSRLTLAEPLLRRNMIALADAYMKATKANIKTVSRSFHGDTPFFESLKTMEKRGNVDGRHVSFTVRKYDEVVELFCKVWPANAIFPDMVWDKRTPSDDAPINQVQP